MSTKTDKTSKFADHIQRTSDLVFEVQIDASEASIAGDLGGIGTFTDDANGQFSLDLSGLGDVDKVLSVEVVSASAGTATVTSSISAGKVLTLAVDSSLDLSAADLDAVIRVVSKRSL